MTATATRLLAFAGSPREGSYHRRLVLVAGAARIAGAGPTLTGAAAQVSS